MKIIGRNLPVNVKYKLVDYSHDKESITECENCGRVIVNLCFIKSDDNKSYVVGTECADRLTGITASEIHEVKRRCRIIAKIVKLIKENETVAVIYTEQVRLYKNQVASENFIAHFAVCHPSSYEKNFKRYVKNERMGEF